MKHENEHEHKHKHEHSPKDASASKHIRRTASRQRVDTEQELQIVEQQFTHQIHIGNPIPCITNIQFALYKLLYHTYLWQSFMVVVFVSTRVLEGVSISHNEWYNDILFFIISNHYLYKRLHWNNDRQKYFDRRETRCFIAFFTVFVGMFVFNLLLPQFYFSLVAVSNYTIVEYICLYIIAFYVCITQVLSFLCLYHSKRPFIFRKQIFKYLLLIGYIFMDYICNALYLFVGKDTLQIETPHPYRLHHWMFGLFMLIFTELTQPYHTILQYIHYAVYLHGVSCYGYDGVLE